MQYVDNAFRAAVFSFPGRVMHKCVRRGENAVECETWAQDHDKCTATLGKSPVALPLRSQQHFKRQQELDNKTKRRLPWKLLLL